MDKLIETYCDVDDFCLEFIEQWQRLLIENGEVKRQRACRLSIAHMGRYALVWVILLVLLVVLKLGMDITLHLRAHARYRADVTQQQGNES